jgi:hypothetical protein
MRPKAVVPSSGTGRLEPVESSRPIERPVRLIVDDDLRRSRVTVLFRLFLVLPHLVWLALWGYATSVVAFALWLAVLIDGRAPAVLHDFAARYLRYATHVGAYLFLVADPYPGFRGAPGYPVDLEIAPPARQSRWSALFRLVLAIPAVFLAAILSGGWIGSRTGGVLGTVAVLGWFASLILGRMPHGLRDLGAYSLGYTAFVTAYVFLLTGRYPSARPSSFLSPAPQLPPHPVRLELDDKGRRSRALVLFRPLLVLPHLVWLLLWGVAILGSIVVGWVATLLLGRLPSPLHRFVTAYVRYACHVGAFAAVVGGPFPGFTGREGSYPVDISVAGPAAQHRLGVAVRAVLAVPALALSGALSSVLATVAVLGWLAALVLGRMPLGLIELGALSIRYLAQTASFACLLTSRYPYAAPAVASVPEQIGTRPVVA